jgi:flagellum-specific peptidoglycan hydrolase FlgJ
MTALPASRKASAGYATDPRAHRINQIAAEIDAAGQREGP